MGFEFKKEKKHIHLSIAGNEFDLVHDGSLAVNMAKSGERALNYSASIGEDTPEDAAYFVYDEIDSLLGDGASDKIFAGRDPDFVEASEVYKYIIDEINKTGQNREQRRAAQKAQAPRPKRSSGGRHYHGKHRP